MRILKVGLLLLFLLRQLTPTDERLTHVRPIFQLTPKPSMRPQSKMRRGADNEAVVTAITLSRVSSGRLNPLTARQTARLLAIA